MRHFFGILLILLFASSSLAQLQVSQSSFDLGDLYIESQRFADVAISNKGKKHHFILRVEKPRNIVYMMSSKRIDPDATSLLRIYVKPGTEGSFKETVQLYLSDRRKPIEITIKGDNKEIAERSRNAQLQSCPDFNKSPTQANINNFDMRIRVVDDATGKPIKNADVQAFIQGQLYIKESSGRNGFIEEDGKFGLFYFEADHKDYIPTSHSEYVNFRRNYVIIRMKQSEPTNEPVEESPPVDTLPEVVPEPEVAESPFEEEEEQDPPPPAPVEEVEETQNEPTFEEAIENYSDGNFKPSNIVFVIDMSSSMDKRGRLELLKIALHELKEMLRPQDRVGIITYSSTAKVFLESTAGDNKEKIGTLINKLYAGGFTAGGDGILLGYEEAEKNFLKDGNNQVIVVTDGAFNRGEKEYKKKIKQKKQDRNINISVVGIKDSRTAEESMREVAKLGNGDYIDVNRSNQAEEDINLNIMKNAFRF